MPKSTAESSHLEAFQVSVVIPRYCYFAMFCCLTVFLLWGGGNQSISTAGESHRKNSRPTVSPQEFTVIAPYSGLAEFVHEHTLKIFDSISQLKPFGKTSVRKIFQPTAVFW